MSAESEHWASRSFNLSASASIQYLRNLLKELISGGSRGVPRVSWNPPLLENPTWKMFMMDRYGKISCSMMVGLSFCATQLCISSEHRLVSTFSTNKLFCWCYNLAVQNLPREDRSLSESIILVGIIPCEPSKVINTILEPLVDDLLKLCEGILMKSAMDNTILVTIPFWSSVCT